MKPHSTSLECYYDTILHRHETDRTNLTVSGQATAAEINGVNNRDPRSLPVSPAAFAGEYGSLSPAMVVVLATVWVSYARLRRYAYAVTTNRFQDSPRLSPRLSQEIIHI
jgi:hypothetical protein